MKRGAAFWLTGLPGSGKTTLALAAKEAMPELVLLQMDEMRKVVTPEPTYSDNEREYLYRALVFTALVLTREGHSVVMDATGNRRAWRDLARRLIPGFHEVFIKCPLETCTLREKTRKDVFAPPDIYKKAEAGWPVPGVNVPYEEPDTPELIIDCSGMGPEKAASEIIEYIESRV
ncbi:MAG TPA: adenylyl-sulfate kinase [Nitrospirota bacterium]|nr:adenylyl-sulfate kinase [Nitrospirota bacterium]